MTPDTGHLFLSDLLNYKAFPPVMPVYLGRVLNIIRLPKTTILLMGVALLMHQLYSVLNLY